MRVKSIRMAGSSVIASTAAIAIARFFEYASGLKSRPSWSTRTNTGRKATAMTSREKNTDGPTSFSASSRTSWKSPFRPPASQRWSLLYAFSTSTMAPSTRTPIEMAMPAIDMMLTVTPRKYIGMNASSTETGIVTIGTTADGMCHRKTRITSDTMIISMVSS